MSSLCKVFETLCPLEPLLICFWRQHTLLLFFFFRFHVLPRHLWTWHWRYWWSYRQCIWIFFLFTCMTNQYLWLRVLHVNTQKKRLQSLFCTSFLTPGEKWAHLKDELQKAQVRTNIHYTNYMQVWLGLHRGYQWEPRVFKYTHTQNTHLTYHHWKKKKKKKVFWF